MLLQPPSKSAEVWSDVTRMQTLNGIQHAKGKEMHLCPMQFDIADRAIEQHTMSGETVFDPFGGLMTTAYRALKLGRKAICTELNPRYFLDGCAYAKAMEEKMAMPTLFDTLEFEVGGQQTATKQTTTKENGMTTLRNAVLVLFFFLCCATGVQAQNATWFIRADGGTRYSANMPQGQCDGLADVAYSGTGANQHCAFNDFRYMWDDRSGVVGAGAWVSAGGDTVVIRGCSALSDDSSSQSNPANPACRLGWDRPYGDSYNKWCYAVGSYTCYNPPIPAGTASNPTKILGGCAYGTNTCTPINNNYPYGATNEPQLYGGFSLAYTFNLAGTQNVIVEGIELTTHNGKCTRGGSPGYPRDCSSNQPLDDYAQNGILTDNTTANVALVDVYIHGFNSAGISGPIGGLITPTRVFSGFNGFAGWNFSDNSDTPDAPGSSIIASYVTMIGNGCYEQYPLVNTAFPAQACYDDLSQGFGDAWSGQDTQLDTLTCDHCVQKYNTKDGFIGPHTAIKHLSITNSASVGNMGSQWKFGTDANATVLFQNNLTEGNPYRMVEALPGAAHTFAASSGLPGAYLSDFGRAAGDTYSIITQAGSSLDFVGNSNVIASATGVDINCGAVNRQGNTSGNGTCGAVPIVWTDNIFLGYVDANCASCGGQTPGLWYKADPSINITSSYNVEYGIRNGDACGTSGILCADPAFVGEPSQTWVNEAAFDGFNFRPAATSPALSSGVASAQLLAVDALGTARRVPPSVGAIEPMAIAVTAPVTTPVTTPPPVQTDPPPVVSTPVASTVKCVFANAAVLGGQLSVTMTCSAQ